VLTCEAGDVALRAGTVTHFDRDAWHSAVFETKTVIIDVNLGSQSGGMSRGGFASLFGQTLAVMFRTFSQE
jgi:hypothetical protein